MTDVVSAPVIAPFTAQPLDGGSQAGEAFPDLLRSHRERAGLTQRALADLSTISPRAIRDLEAGRANARTQTIYLLADGLRLHGLMRELFIHAGLSGRRGGPFDVELGPAVPKPVNALLGRDTEVRALADVLESGRRRVVSISGLPGVGKTRVAAEISTRLSARRGWPVLWLGTDARVGPGTAFGPLVRSVRSLIESDTEDVARVCQLFGRHEALLVLDGLADSRVPPGVEELLAYCSGIRVISTSRAPWHVTGVQATVLSPLATPGPGSDTGPMDALAGVASIRLLVDRLVEVRSGFALTPANAGAAAEICRRLDGLPLALEVVAGRFRVLSLQQLTDVRMGDLLDFTVPPRAERPGAVADTIGGLLGATVARLDGEQRAILQELVRSDRTWTVPDVAAARRRPLDEVVDDLSVLIGFGMVRASDGEAATALRVPNLLRAWLLHTRRAA